MKKLLLATGIAAGLAANLYGQGVILQNMETDAGGTNGAVHMPDSALFDGHNFNLGVVVSGGPSPGNLYPMGTFTAASDPKGHTGLDMGTFQLGPAGSAIDVPGVSAGGTAWIRLQIWYDAAGGLFPSYAAALAGGGLVADVLFENLTSNLPLTTPPLLVGMPNLVLTSQGPFIPPTITQQPQSLTVMRGDSATLSVVASGTPPPSYQWRLNGTNISWAIGSVLVVTNAQPTNAGAYSVTVYNYVGTTNSSNAILTVLYPPLIVAQPQGTVGYWGGNAQFGVDVDGTKPLSYQWYKENFPIAWGTNSTLTLTNLDFTDAANYWVAVTNLHGSTDSTSALLVVNPVGVWLGTHPFLTITGAVGKTYGIEYTTQVSQTNSWTALTNLTLTQPVQEWIDTSVNAVVTPQRFYRVVPIP